MTTRGLLIVISGPGGVGKDTVINLLRQRNPRLRYSVSYTTRPMRPYEVPDEHYSFVDEPAFRRMADDDVFLEYAVVNGYMYGTSAERAEEIQQTGEDVVLKIDVQGADQVRQRRPDGIYIFIEPPSMAELVRRRLERGVETEAEIQQRQRLAEWEMSFTGLYDHRVVNDDLDRAVGEVEAILERTREARRAAGDP